MKKQTTLFWCVVALTFVAVNISACGKSGPAPSSSDACAGKTIVITANPTNATACGTNGSIVVSASGSSGFTYKLNSGGTYQASGSFTDVAVGTYTVFAKDADGCEKSVAANVSSGGSAGPLFTSVKNLVNGRCVSCHNATIQNGGMNFAVECNIVAAKVRIKVRAVDQGSMPTSGPLSQSEKDIITAWINAGGLYTN